MDELHELVDRLNNQKRLRLWSVIVTFFGDVIVPRGGTVSAKTVQQLMEHIGFEAGAVRTAFSRLVSDGWVVREKVGRSSHFQLSERGASTFAKATKKIYAPLPETIDEPESWTIVFSKDDFSNPIVFPTGQSVSTPGLAQDDLLIIEGSFKQIPAWFRAQELSPRYGEAFEQLMKDFKPVLNQPLSELDALAVRCLLIHEWRRILLHLPDVHHFFQPKDWPETACHEFVSNLYHSLLGASESWIDQNGEGKNGQLPAANIDLSKRFF